MVQFHLESAPDKAHGREVAETIWKLLDDVNRRDTRMAYEVSREHGEGEFCAHPQSVYGTLKAALQAVLMALGVREAELDMAWQAVLDGYTVQEVIDMHTNL